MSFLLMNHSKEKPALDSYFKATCIHTSSNTHLHSFSPQTTSHNKKTVGVSKVDKVNNLTVQIYNISKNFTYYSIVFYKTNVYVLYKLEKQT